MTETPDAGPSWRCLFCGSRFALVGSAPRLRVVEWLVTYSVVEVGETRSVTYEPPEAFTHQAVCPDCVRDHHVEIAQLEQNARVREQTR